MQYDLIESHPDGDHFISSYDTRAVIMVSLVEDIQASDHEVVRALCTPWNSESILYSKRYFYTIRKHNARHFDKMVVEFSDGIILGFDWNQRYLYVTSQIQDFNLHDYLFRHSDLDSELFHYKVTISSKVVEKFSGLFMPIIEHLVNISGNPESVLSEYKRFDKLIDAAQTVEDVLREIPDTRPYTISEWCSYVESNHITGDALNYLIYDIIVHYRLWNEEESEYDFIQAMLRYGINPNFIYHTEKPHLVYDSVLRYVDLKHCSFYLKMVQTLI